MFSGIVEAIGKIVKYDGAHLGIRTPFRHVRLGESLSIDGVCLTVTRKRGSVLFFDVGPQTRRITTLGRMKAGSQVNLERSLRVGDRIGGHWVTGHVERTGQVQKLVPSGRNRWLFVSVPRDVARYVVSKGSIAIDGVSLTVAAVRNKLVKIMVIPHTLSHTTLRAKQAGDAVNVEPDFMAKYLSQLKGKR